MKILHTSDWHIGKRLGDRERLKEQEEVLDEIGEICAREGVDIIIVAGDVFDTYVPSAEAEELFFRKAKKLAKNRALVVISGNHDDGVRLSSSAPFAEESGVYILGNKPYAFQSGEGNAVRLASSGENYLILENGAGERVYLNLLPYPNEARLKEDKSDESYSEKAARWIARGEAGYKNDMPHILVSHLFVAGCSVSDSERDIDLGGARAVPVSVLPDYGYIALGHLHRRQKAGERGYYCGSILQYAFDEANTEKSVTLLETQGNDIKRVKDIPLTKGKKLVRLECVGVESALELLPRYEGCFIELTLGLDAPLTSAQTQALRESNAGLVSLIAHVKQENEETLPVRSALKPAELFSLYYKSQYGGEPPCELVTAFLELVEGRDETDQT